MFQGRRYLALDQAARRIGYAIGSADMVEPVLGCFEPQSAGARHGVLMGSVRDWLDKTIKLYRIKKVCFETPFAGVNAQVFAVVNKMIGVVELVCDDHEIPCVEVTAQEWRKEFFGVTRAPKAIPKSQRRAWLKGQAIHACRDRGWDVENDDQADAAGILNYVLGRDFESYRERVWNGTHPNDQA
jgi:Holliday junction resolvasome RuvABC endonuclease subunit